MQDTNILQLTIPNAGEGLKTVRIVKLYKQPGEIFLKDETIFDIETDKAILSIPAESSGKLLDWHVAEGDVIEVGKVIGDLALTEVAESTFTPSEINPYTKIPPRTRAYCKSKNLDIDEVIKIRASSGKLMPQDVDQYLQAKSHISRDLEQSSIDKHSKIYQLPLSQKTLNSQFRQSQSLVVPANIMANINLDKLENLFAKYQKFHKSLNKFITLFQVFAFCLVRSVKDNAKFKSVLLNDDTVEEYEYLNLGVAINLGNNELTTIVIERADSLCFADFILEFERLYIAAQNGENVMGCPPHIVLSYLGDSHIVSGTPLLVYPAIATLALCGRKEKLLSMTFDHRLINGYDANKFIESLLTTIDFLDKQSSSQSENAKTKSTDTSGDNSGEGTFSSIQHKVIEQISRVLECEYTEVKIDHPLGLQGLDSFKAVSFINRLQEFFDKKLPVTLIWQHPTCLKLTEYLSKNYVLKAELEKS